MNTIPVQTNRMHLQGESIKLEQHEHLMNKAFGQARTKVFGIACEYYTHTKLIQSETSVSQLMEYLANTVANPAVFGA